MAHYDCSNCGASMGCSFGSCESCTPPEYFELEKKVSAIYRQADTAWEEAVLIHKRQFIKEWQEANGVPAMRARLGEIEEKCTGRRLRNK